MHVLAIDIGGTKVIASVFVYRGSERPQLVRRERRSTHRQGGREWMMAELQTLLPGLIAGLPIAACGVGFGGPVDFAAQRVALSTHVTGWAGFDLREALQDLLHVPSVLDNDANTGALGEALYGAGMVDGRPVRPLFYMTLSTGIGGAIVLHEDKVYRGADSWAGEIGHLTIRPEGPECLCGARGCFERMCCGLWLERDYGRPPELLLQDPAFVQRYVVDVAMGMKAAVMLLNPARIILGGGLAKAGEALFQPLRAELGRQITAWSGARVDLVPAALGDDSVVWGASALAARLAIAVSSAPQPQDG